VTGEKVDMDTSGEGGFFSIYQANILVERGIKEMILSYCKCNVLATLTQMR
jgi:hypothetical protein